MHLGSTGIKDREKALIITVVLLVCCQALIFYFTQVSNSGLELDKCDLVWFVEFKLLRAASQIPGWTDKSCELYREKDAETVWPPDPINP